MTFWLFSALLLVAPLGAMLWPLVARGRPRADASDVEIYKDQLGEIERDRTLGMVDDAALEASRIEIGRRLIRAAREHRDSTGGSRRAVRAAALGLLVAVPAASLAGYVLLGSPQLPDAPLQARLSEPASAARLDELVGRVEAHLRERPDDAQGWQVVAPVYVRMGRLDDAVNAFEHAIRLTPPDAELLSGYGEALVMQASGMVTDKAREAFEKAARLAPGVVKPRFFLALALSQDRRFAEAVSAWSELIEGAPQDAQWVQIAKARLEEAQAGLSGTAPAADGTARLPGPSRQDVEAASRLDGADRAAFIRSMVEGLAARLDSEGGSIDEWLRLIRAYAVLGHKDDARAAYAKAREAHGADQGALAQLKSSAEALGVEVGPTGTN